MKLANRRRRYLAALIDFGICLLIALLITSFALPGLWSLIVNEDRWIIINFWSVLDTMRWLVVSIIFIVSYYTLVPVILPGQTLGKRLLGIKVIKKNGTEVTFATMFVREIIGRILFDFTSFGFTILLSIILVTRKERWALNDILADTIVIIKEEEEE